MSDEGVQRQAQRVRGLGGEKCVGRRVRVPFDRAVPCADVAEQEREGRPAVGLISQRSLQHPRLRCVSVERDAGAEGHGRQQAEAQAGHQCPLAPQPAQRDPEDREEVWHLTYGVLRTASYLSFADSPIR